MRTAFLMMTTVLAGLMTPAAAQVVTEPLLDEETEEVVEPLKRYTVELIIFAYADSTTTGTEVWTPNETAVEATDGPGSDGYFDDFGAELMEIEVAVARRYMDLELVLFDEDDYTMTDVYDKLVELDAYDPLVRAGWTQPTFEKELTGPIALQTLAESPPWLDGSLTLYLGRYLHLVVNLTMDADRTVAEDLENLEVRQDKTSIKMTFGDARMPDEYGAINAYGELLAPPIRYRIFEDRIMKNGDVRYFDHPKFGIIAKITRYEEPEEEEFIDDTDDLLPG